MTGYLVETGLNWQHFLQFIGGLYLLSSGSLALNQVQEYKLDAKMPRTANRPIASGRLPPLTGAILSICMILGGSLLLWRVSILSSVLGWLTIVLYNVFYTYFWKPKMVYAAIPGALPGALPVTIGYAAVNPDIFNSESIYLFLILFLWQMPHFWALALKYKDDYRSGEVPTLPAALGIDKTLKQMVLFTYLYVGLALLSPWLLTTSWFYIALVVPFSLFLFFETQKFFKQKGQVGWLRYFLAINLSVLIFVFVPALDKWNLWF